ncbi:MAG TPA: hypothetical protein QGH10_15435, partial [Armatimonadota bacterium]|nr:hypothetical protein [Armatimonadota bacterium]
MSDYDQSQDLATRADTALAAGDIATARQLHRDAGEIQARLVAALPPDRVRTRSAFGLSAASLLYRGQALDEAERLVHQLLAGGVADDGCHGRLRALLCRIWNERRLSEIDVREESGASLSVTLQGGRVLYGRAPIGVVDMVTRLTTNYIRRMAAWRNGRAYRRRETGTGDDLIEGYRAHAFEPVASSYRVEFHLARHQLALDLGPAFSGQATPTDIIDGCMTLARLVRTSRQDEVREYIQDPKYRGALVRLVHALVPDGHDIGEVELRRPEEEKERAVRLSHAMRRPVGSLLRAI